MDRRSSAITPWDLECMLCDETAEPKALPLSLLEEITKGFSDEQEIGRGGFAVVYMGMLENRIVAVKRMSNTYMYEKEFQREVECLMTAKHNNVVRFLGYCADTQGTMERLEGKFVMADVQQRLLCFEYLPKGSLDKYITDTSHGLQWSDRYQIIMGICQGLHYLHQKNIVHLDLKPANILLDGNLVPKITDFGISRCFHEIQSRDITTIAGTFGYLAPESFNNTKVTYRHSYRLDIYSLGVVITEILTGERGYHDVDNVVESWSNMLEKSQCDVQLKQVRVCAEIGVDCIDSNPAKRPDTEHIINRLNEYNEIGVITSQQSVSNSLQLATKVRCLCSSTLLNDNMIKCEDDRCHVWQHMTCVLVPDRPTDGVIPKVPPHFYCELCRLSRADPFWVTTGHLLPPVKFMSSGVDIDGTSVFQTSEKNFQLSRADRRTIQRSEYDLQVWCILMDDEVQFRMQWPQYAEMEVNGTPVRVFTRPGSQLLGINGRDDGPLITTVIREGTNKISLRMLDTRTFCFGVRMARPRIIRQVFNLVPREAEGESFEDALTRVRHCLGGGDTTENADSDSDVEVVAESFTVSLRCPNSGSRMETAGRFKPCIHMGCFDLDTFVELNQRSRKWQCPICLKNYSLENLIIDPYFNRITSLLRHCSLDVNEIDIKPDGSWRVKGLSTRELSQWHMPDGTLREYVKPDVENFNELKIEGTYDGHNRSLKFGVKRRRHKSNEVDDKKPSVVGNHTQNVITCQDPNTFPVSNSPSGSYRGEDTSVNQGGSMHHSMHINLSLNRYGHEFDRFPTNVGLTYSTEDTSQQQHNVGDAIVIGYSDKENGNIICPPTVYDNTTTHDSGFTFATNSAGFTGRCQEDAGVGTSGLDLISNKADDFLMNNWQMHSSLQLEQGFQFFGNGSDISNTSIGLHSSSSIPPNDYSLHCSVGSEEASVSHVLPVSHNSNEMHGSLVDNPLAFSGDDPSSLPLHEEPSESVNAANGLQSDDWISLTLAAGGDGNEESAPASGSNLQQQIQSNEQEAASALARTNNNIHNGANLVFSQPRPRSVRPRLCLSIDTDSE